MNRASSFLPRGAIIGPFRPPVRAAFVWIRSGRPCGGAVAEASDAVETLRGIPVSPGVAFGRVLALDDVRRRIPRRRVSAAQAEREVERFDEAVAVSIRELKEQRSRTKEELGGEAAKIFAFHLGMLSDANLADPIRSRIRAERVTAEFAVSQQFRHLVEQFEGMGGAFATKVDDVWDLDRRVLGHLIGEHRGQLETMSEPSVVIAPELTPSQTASFDATKVMAFATDSGGRTSHTAIMARALGIPAVVGLERVTERAADGDVAIVDGDRGLVILHPDEETVASYEAYADRMREFRRSLAEVVTLPAETTDGVRVTVMGNIEFPDEAAKVVELGGDGVGLFRTEFLHLRAGRAPTEEEHYEAYAEAVRGLEGRPLTIRTLDLGSDKQTRDAPPERNPALGRRSIRQSLQEIGAFRAQLRAALRASASGPVQLMFPLVTNVLEQRQARMIVEDVKEDLTDEGIAFDPRTPIGMMMETPAAALMAPVFAREVDFFSIGTNDLVQYTLAVDRTNALVASLYSAAHPAVIRLIKEIVRSAKRREVPVSVCGEAAGEIEYTMLLIGLGLRSLSVTPSLIPTVKRVIRSVDVTMCERVARKVGSFDSERQVSAFLRDQTRAIIPEVFGGRPVE